MTKQTTHRLSAEAMNDLRAIVQKEISESMTDEEIEDMGIKLLRLFSILVTQEPKPAGIQPTDQEQKALDFLDAEIKKSRSPSVRELARMMGLKSSRSGYELLKKLITQGLVKRDNKGMLRLLRLS